MRIQHNVTALNAYRNYNNNTSAISKNLEKLSSGYKINRAGDDAAGLAVSQKMRLQIAGLEQAQKNAKSGISYVQTAEGALQEVHDMLERMYTLAEQSANGTYDEDTDRVQLQKEVNSLMEEIDRIGKTANFNGMGIFAEYDGAGSTSSTSDATDSTTGTSTTSYVTATGTFAGADLTSTDVPATTTPAVAAVYTIDVSGFTDGDTLTIDGTTISYNTSVDQSFDGVGETDGGNYTLTYASNTLTITAKTAGADTLELTDNDKVGGSKATLETTTAGADETSTEAYTTYDLSGTLADSDSITVDGKTYTYADSADGSDGETFGDLTSLKAALAVNGVTMDDTDDSAVTFTKTTSGSGSSDGSDGGESTKGSISFWIGAEYNTNNELTISDMHLCTTNMSVGAPTYTSSTAIDVEGKAGDLTGVDITTAESAMSSLQKIKDASDAVSDMRGTLGAMQNRLDHTINNLSVMQENMTDAESVIRDTDVAEEMMAYTKNSILVQSAQAMLAQANQLPQGVLQLLQ